MTRWPNNIPPDLRTTWEGTLSARNAGPAELWGDMVDWLRKHGVEAPDDLPVDKRPEGFRP